MRIPWKVLWHLRIEPYLWFMMLGSSVRVVTYTQVIQDKLCRLEHHREPHFCRTLAELSDTDNGTEVKSSVLSVSTTFNMYYQGLAFLPSIIACLFLGSWCDTYKHGRKILLYVSAVGLTLETAIYAYTAYDFQLNYWFTLLAAVPSALGGGVATCYTAILSYIPATTPQSFRTFRFMLFEAIIWLSTPVSTALGGYLLNYNIDQPIGGNGQLFNYQLVFIVSAVCTLTSFILVWLMIDEKRDKYNLEKFDPEHKHKQRAHQLGQQKKPQIRPLESIIEEENTKNGFLLLFDWDNVRDIIRTAIKRRPNRVRLQIWLIVSSLVFVLMADLAPLYVMYPFAQKVYLWDSKTYSLYNSLALLVNAFGIFFGTIIMTRVLKMSDLALTITGIISYFVSCVLRGTFTQLYGFWASTGVGCIGGVASIGMRSHLSKIIDKNELGKVFSLIAAIDGSVPLVTNFVFTVIFTATLDSFPGAVFDAVAALLFLPLTALIYIDVFCRKSSIKSNINMNDIKDRRDKQQSIDRNEHQLSYKTRADIKGKQLTTDL